MSCYRNISKENPPTMKELMRMIADCITYKMPLRDLEAILETGIDPNISVHKGLRPIHYAAYENSVECLELLVDYGAQINVGDDTGYTPLHIAAKHGHMAALRFLIRKGAIIDFENAVAPKGSAILAELTVQPLNLAIENDHPKAVQYLLDHGADPNKKYFLGHEINLCPLENLECLDILLEYGADPDAYNRSGVTALMKACKAGEVDAVNLLIKHGAKVNLSCHPKIQQRRPLHFAALGGNVEITKILLEAGAETTRPDEFRYSPIEFAITQGKLEITEELLNHGANPDELNEDLCTPLQVAASTLSTYIPKADTIRMLLDHGANPNYACSTFSYVGPSLCPLLEYFTYEEPADYDIGIIQMFLSYGSDISICQPVRVTRIINNCGILPQLVKMMDNDQIMYLILGVATYYNPTDIGAEKTLPESFKSVLMEESSKPQTLKNQIRLFMRKIFSRPIPQKIKQLGLPSPLEKFLLFQI